MLFLSLLDMPGHYHYDYVCVLLMFIMMSAVNRYSRRNLAGMLASTMLCLLSCSIRSCSASISSCFLKCSMSSGCVRSSSLVFSSWYLGLSVPVRI